MKVVAFNGSPKKEGNTYHALKLVCEQLEEKGIETEIVNVGVKNVKACMACNMCFKNRDEKCVIKNDDVNDWIQKMKEADGILLGSPVHYSSLSAGMKSFLDRAFYVAGANGSLFRHKVGASVVAVRRSGGLPVFNELNNYLAYSEMMIPSSNYWNVIHGLMPGEVHQDEEGVQIMRILGKNMAYLMEVMKNGKATVEAPEQERKILTNFVR
ncbi:flavodoxin family protein [Marinifilum flexuosum]|uniref:Multimeric flavodoxin WrbA n=1 Tax=Marinifilum flexuosum TaxID=1117708 RepID=A0A419WT49_9BACT|nr:flavodoxin family protein [Marinifilum flexuosum]RKD98612.1 multimeric flavodoxin WrbA [Marinifilum flexuosum]